MKINFREEIYSRVFYLTHFTDYCKNGNTEVTCALLKKGYDINLESASKIYLNSWNNGLNINLVQNLMENDKKSYKFYNSVLY